MEVILRAIGQRVVGACEQSHFYGDSQPALIACGLSFEGGLEVWFRVDSIGHGIVVEESAKTNYEMGQYGSIKLLDASRKLLYADIIGRRLARVIGLVASDSEQPIGLNLYFQPSGQLVVVNWGDDLYVSDNLNELLRREPLHEVQI